MTTITHVKIVSRLGFASLESKGKFNGDLLAILGDYRRLHDMLSDMIEGGRLKEADIPDDYEAIVEQLAKLANALEDV